MRLTVVPLSLAAFGLVAALPDDEAQPPLEKKEGVEILSDIDFCSQAPRSASRDADGTQPFL
jgi:hypothetical protein